MSERYSKLFTLPGNLYSTGSPVVVAAGSLLKDNQTGKVLVQLKIQNISEKTIKAAKVTISPLDTVGRLLGDCVNYQYLDLKTNRDDFFGQKTAIPLPDSATRSFSVSVAEVAFSDNSVWSASEEPWEMLSSPTRLEEKLGWNEAELLKQYHLDHGSNRQYWPTEVKDLWYCSCGVLNHKKESQCHSCGKSLEDQLAVEIETLKAERDARLEREAEARERKAQEEKRQAEERAKREAKEKEERTKKQKSLVKNCSIAAAAAVLVIVLGVLLTTKVIIPIHNYNSAVSLMENGDYTAAIKAFKAMDGYKDSEDMVVEAENRSVYATALDYMESGEYSVAIIKFNSLGDYSDAQEKIVECQNLENEADYQAALGYMESGKYVKAIMQFESLGDYSDAQEKIVECQNLEKGEYYRIALDYMDSGDYSKAIEKFEYLGDYSDAQEKLVECQNLKNEADYQKALDYMESAEYSKAIYELRKLGDYSDAAEKLNECLELKEKADNQTTN
jgi:tetratricopeptide (TPR) repeat protein